MRHICIRPFSSSRTWCYTVQNHEYLALLAQKEPGDAVFDDHNVSKAVSWRDEAAPPVIARRTRLSPDAIFQPGHGRCARWKLEAIRADILKLEEQTEGLLAKIVGTTKQ